MLKLDMYYHTVLWSVSFAFTPRVRLEVNQAFLALNRDVSDVGFCIDIGIDAEAVL